MLYTPHSTAPKEIYTEMRKQAVLAIFEPNYNHQLGIHAHRPNMMTLSDRFIGNVYDISEMNRVGGAPKMNGMYDNLLRSPDARSIIMPSLEPDALINLNSIGLFWRFTLILNKPKAPDLGVATMFSNMVSHRVILSGYFLQEPMNKRTGTVNPNAQMVFTHKTVIEAMHQQSQSGFKTTRLDTRYDASIVQAGVTSLSTNPDLFYIDPMNSYEATYDDSAGQTIASPGHQQRVGYNDVNMPLDTRMQNPEHCLRYVVGKIVSSKKEIYDKPHLSNLYSENHINLPYQAQETFHETLSRNMRSVGNTASLLGWNENDVVTIEQVGREYDVEVAPCFSDGTGMFDVMDQRLPTPNNVFCSLIASATPPVMIASALNMISFKFTSYYDRQDPLHPYGLDIYAVTPAMPMTSDLIRDRVNAVIGEFDRSIFRSMYETRGDFELSGFIDLGGLTHLRLHFLSDSQIFREPYEHPTIMSGMVTPLMGDARACGHNTSQIAQLVNRMTTDDTLMGEVYLPEFQAGMNQPRPDLMPMSYGTQSTNQSFDMDL